MGRWETEWAGAGLYLPPNRLLLITQEWTPVFPIKVRPASKWALTSHTQTCHLVYMLHRSPSFPPTLTTGIDWTGARPILYVEVKQFFFIGHIYRICRENWKSSQMKGIGVVSRTRRMLSHWWLIPPIKNMAYQRMMQALGIFSVESRTLFIQLSEVFWIIGEY